MRAAEIAALACCAPVAAFVLYVMACMAVELWRLWPSPWWDPLGAFHDADGRPGGRP